MRTLFLDLIFNPLEWIVQRLPQPETVQTFDLPFREVVSGAAFFVNMYWVVAGLSLMLGGGAIWLTRSTIRAILGR